LQSEATSTAEDLALFETFLNCPLGNHVETALDIDIAPPSPSEPRSVQMPIALGRPDAPLQAKWKHVMKRATATTKQLPPAVRDPGTTDTSTPRSSGYERESWPWHLPMQVYEEIVFQPTTAPLLCLAGRS